MTNHPLDDVRLERKAPEIRHNDDGSINSELSKEYAGFSELEPPCGMEEVIGTDQVMGLHEVRIGKKYLVSGFDDLASMVGDFLRSHKKRLKVISQKLQEATDDFIHDDLRHAKGQEYIEKKNRFERSYEEANKVLRELPQDIPIPGVVPEPNGEIGLEWRKDEKGFLISFAGEGVIIFAGYFGEKNETHGVKQMQTPLPKSIIDNIYELFSTDL